MKTIQKILGTIGLAAVLNGCGTEDNYKNRNISFEGDITLKNCLERPNQLKKLIYGDNACGIRLETKYAGRPDTRVKIVLPDVSDSQLIRINIGSRMRLENCNAYVNFESDTSADIILEECEKFHVY